ncbi:MAG: TPM domain-containing protein [Bacteroidota bacterium]
MSHVEDFLTSEEENEIVVAIKEAEKNTSGEIRVHIESCTHIKCFERAKEIFYFLNMHNTKDKNGVLFYVAVDDREFAIIGDEGIDKVVPDGFWDSVKNRVTGEFAKDNHGDGLVLGIIEAGQKLQQYFPYQRDDINELPDEISKG